MSEKYTIDNAKNDIQNLQDQNKYDFQEIKRLKEIINEYSKRVTQAINLNNQINKKIQYDYEKIKKNIIDENITFILDKKIDDKYNSNKNLIDELKLSNKNEFELINNEITNVNSQLNNSINELDIKKANLTDVVKISSGTPLFANSVSNMIDTTKNYVNTTDGYLYTYNGTTFINSNIKYQETGLSNKQVTPDKTSFLEAEYLRNSTLSKQISNTNSWWETIETYNINSINKYLIASVDRVSVSVEPSYGWLKFSFLNENNETISYFSLDWNDSDLTSKKLIPENAKKVKVSSAFEWSKVQSSVTVSYINLKLYVEGAKLTNDISVPYLDDKISNIKGLEKIYKLDEISSVGKSTTNINKLPTQDTNENFRISPLMKIGMFKFKNIKIMSYTYVDSIEYFDYQKIKIGKFAVSNDNQIVTESDINIPVNAMYIRFNYRVDKQHEGYIVNVINNELSEYYRKIDKNYYESINHYKYLFEKCLCIGDSITEGCNGETGKGIFKYAYPYYLNKLTDWEVVNKGKSGATAKSYFNQMIAQIDNIEYFDNIIVFLGTNDLNNGGYTDTVDIDAVGNDYNDYLDTNTGNYCKLISYLKQNKNENCNIWLCTLLRNYDDTDVMLTTNSTIKKIGERYGCNIIDLYYKSNLINAYKNIYAPADGVHLTKIGYLDIAKTMIDLICETVDNNKISFRS